MILRIWLLRSFVVVVMWSIEFWCGVVCSQRYAQLDVVYGGAESYVQLVSMPQSNLYKRCMSK